MTNDISQKRIGQPLLFFEELPNTIDYAKQNAPSLPNGAVVFAARQTGGRGRLGRPWQDAAPGSGLAMSVLLRPRLAPEQFSLLPLITGMAVQRALQSLAPGLYGIKWPNDVVLNGKKVCGILCETVWEQTPFSVLGIGVNLLQDSLYFKACGLPHATSLFHETGRRVPMDVACKAVCSHLEILLATLEEDGFPALQEAYEAHCVSLHRQVQVILAGKLMTGYAKGIDNTGNLLVQFEDAVHSIHAGEASVRGLYGYV